MVNRLLHGSLMIQYHHKLMPLVWSVFIDISILAALYSHKKFAFPVHVIGATLAGIITIVTSFASFLNGIPPVGNPMRLHKQIGTFLYMLIVTQMLLGILWYIIRSSLRRSQWSLILKKIHKTVGYSIAIIAKFQVLYILDSSSFLFWFNLLWDTITILLLLKAKRSKIKAESNPQLKVINSSYRQIKSIQQISLQYPNIFLYGNYVFSCEYMKNKHPAGYQLIIQSKDHCIDRYIYGMFAPENIPSIQLHSHSPKSLAMLVQPIAKIRVSEQYSNFQMQNYSVKIHSADSICLKGGLFCVRLKLLQKQTIEYQGYSQIQQLGRYYSLTLNQQMTRLYSTVNFALRENRNFINNLNLKINTSMKSLSFFQQNDKLIQGISQQLHEQETVIPLIIKKYNDGRFTKQLFHHQARKLTLSCSKGRGLQLATVQHGKIIIVAGGTGLLPFCDLIDLLFKQELVRQQPQYKEYLLNKNSILKRPFLQNNTFTFIIAVNYLKEIHPIILSQLIYLTQISDRFEVYLRVKDNSEGFTKLKIVNGHFQGIVEQKIRDQLVSKVLVCGPCSLNKSMKTLFSNLNFKSFLIL